MLRKIKMSAKDLSKANVGDTVELLWRDELSTPFSRRSIFGDDGKPISGKCIATRFAGGWRMAALPALAQVQCFREHHRRGAAGAAHRQRSYGTG